MKTDSEHAQEHALAIDGLSLSGPLSDFLKTICGSKSVLEALGIDCEQNASESFDVVCRKHELDPQTVARVLAAQIISIEKASTPGPVELMSLTDLCNHLQTAHHGSLQTELSRLDLFLRKIEENAQEQPRVQQVRERFDIFRDKLAEHLREEAEVLFPLIRQLDDPRIAGTGVMDLLRMPVSQMKHEHTEIDEELGALETMTSEADAAFQPFREGLQRLETLLHGQIYQENQILFRRVLALVASD